MPNASAPILNYGPSNRWLHNWGQIVICGAFSFAVLVLLFLTWKVDWALPFFPVLLLGGVGMWWLFQRPLLNLAIVLASFVLIADFEEGIQITEVFYGLYYLGFLSLWFFKHLFLDKRVVFERPEEKAIWVFLILVTLSFPLSLLFGGTFQMWLGEWLSLTLLAFYFPVKQAVLEEKNGLRVMIGVVIFVGIFILGRNVLEYLQAIGNAEQAWEIAKGRAVTNEGLLMVPAFFSLALYLNATDWKHKTVFSGLFIAFVGGLILTQSRGYWVAFFLGTLVLFWMIPPKKKGTLIITGVLASAVVSAVAIIVLGDALKLVVVGLLDRLSSIGSATTKDISLVNRFIETGAVWEHVKSNPILGHGMGVSYRFYDITYQFSDTKPFIHNGYIALLYKFGIWGTPLILGFLIAVVRKAVLLYRTKNLDPLVATSCLAVVACMAAFSLSANTSNPFYVNDPMFIFSVMMGIVGGGYSIHLRNCKAKSR